MTNYNERLDEVLLTYKSAHQIAFNEVDPHGNNMSPYDGSAAVSKRSRDIEAEAKADLTSLIKELVAEARIDELKSVFVDFDEHKFLTTGDTNTQLITFDQRIAQLTNNRESE